MSGDANEPGGGRNTDYQLATWGVIGGTVVLVLALIGVRLEHQPDTSRNYPSRALIPDGEAVLLPSAELDDEYFPCTDCHEDQTTNRTVRKLEEDHEDLELEHGTLWCLSCHDADHRDSLHLADASLLEFDESWRLCTQCHAHKLADWKAGVHGKRTGHWRGEKQYRTCVSCHNPHNPPFQPLAPKPPPKRPEQIVVHGIATPGGHDEDS